jgi:hypothetical protein
MSRTFWYRYQCDWCGLLDDNDEDDGVPDDWLNIEGQHMCGLCKESEKYKDAIGDCLSA